VNSVGSKDEVLKALKENGGGFLSGEKLAETLGISRNSVWKAINSLRKSGYAVEAVTNKGYCLKAPEDEITKEGILIELESIFRGTEDVLAPFDGSGSARWIPADFADRIHVLREIDSTNRLAKEMALSGCPHGTVIIAEKQSRGSAHGKESFVSPEGGVYISFVLRPQEMTLPPSLLSRYIAVCVVDAVYEATGIKTQIGGVNDILLNRRKIGGTLNETVSDLEHSQIQWIVTGTGIHYARPAFLRQKKTDKSLAWLYEDRKADVPRSRLIAHLIGRILFGNAPSKEEIPALYRQRHVTQK
jgi:BirA family biotin operon repressor/biotin-[acetyl-CoA-carboxylase] ligase